MPNDPEDFNKINGINNPDNKDDIIDSSFGVRFKPGDKTESIADKLKETKENIEKKTTETASAGTSRFDPSSSDGFKDSFKDEFDNFEFDSSISAFKPFNAPQQTEAPKSAPIPEALKPKPASNEPVFPKDGGTFDKPAFTAKAPEPPKEALPKFNEIDSKPDSAKPANDKFFNSGNGLDFATSEHDKKTSPFANAEKPEQPKAANIDIPGTDKPAAPAAAPAKPVNPFASSAPAPEAKPAQKAPDAPKGQPAGYRPHPSASMTNLFTTPTQATMNAEKAFAEFLDDDFKPSTQAPISPFKSVAQKAPAATAPSAPAPAPAKPVEPAKPAAPVAPAKPVESVKPEAPVAPAKPVEPQDLQHLLLPLNPLNPQDLQHLLLPLSPLNLLRQQLLPEQPLQQLQQQQQRLQHPRLLIPLKLLQRLHSLRDLQRPHLRQKHKLPRQKLLHLRHPHRDPELQTANLHRHPDLRQHRMHLIHLSRPRANSLLPQQEAYPMHHIRTRPSLL